MYRIVCFTDFDNQRLCDPVLLLLFFCAVIPIFLSLFLVHKAHTYNVPGRAHERNSGCYRLWRVVCSQETANMRRLKARYRAVKNTTKMGCNARETNKQTMADVLHQCIRISLCQVFQKYLIGS